MESLYAEFKKVMETQYTHIITEEFDQITSNLKTILPNRHKRWDTIGTVWKFVAGSPDADDLRLINTTINNLISNNNAQVKINEGLVSRLNDSLGKIREAITIFTSSSMELYSINIFLNLKHLSDRVKIIIESITLAKLGITNIQLLNQKEIDMIVADIKRNNLPIHTIIESLSYTTTKAAVSNSELVLIITVPRLEDKIYKKIQVYPVTNSNRIIHVPNPYFLSYQHHIYAVSSLGPAIYQPEDLQEEESTCVAAILNQEQPECDMVYQPAIPEVMSLDMTHLMINTGTTFNITTNCGLKERVFNEPLLITYTSCTILMNGKEISNNRTDLPGSLIHLPLYGVQIHPKGNITNLSLDNLNDLHIEMRKEMEAIKLESNSFTWTWKWTPPLFIGIPLIIFVGYLIVLQLKKKSRRIEVQVTSPTEVTNSENNQIFQPPTITHVFRTEAQN